MIIKRENGVRICSMGMGVKGVSQPSHTEASFPLRVHTHGSIVQKRVYLGHGEVT